MCVDFDSDIVNEIDLTKVRKTDDLLYGNDFQFCVEKQKSTTKGHTKLNTQYYYV